MGLFVTEEGHRGRKTIPFGLIKWNTAKESPIRGRVCPFSNDQAKGHHHIPSLVCGITCLLKMTGEIPTI